MAASSGKELQDAVLGQFAPEGSSTAVALAKAAFVGFRALAHLGKDNAASDNSTFTLDDNVGVGLRCTSANVVFTSAVTSDNTSYVSIQLVSNNGNGGADTIIGMANTTNSGAALGTGNISAGVPVALTLTDANVVVDAGEQLQVKFLKYGSGVSLPAASVVVKADWE